ncbi:homoserine/homoserine lactone efflux protein [Vibrio sp. T187]|uniref:homoserine/homoserine lactone efflux protein n=1 Tax=Vibrio TaxID=662 RepID=UPI0010C9DA8B|nr:MULTISPECIES: homoserine/homoserine lactone efflux protein [Vibrio]MBW3697777.1 homoserine/homoserine lactone efflux protein [Vibrio sp. T187]
MDLYLWLGFASAALLISISPGAGAVNTMSSGVQNGVKGALPSILGLQLGYGIQIALVCIGIDTFLAKSSLVFEVVKWLGVAYLVWLGYQKWSQAVLDMDAPLASNESANKKFWTAALVNLTNPKATVFLLALFPQFLSADDPTGSLQYIVMGCTLIVADIIVMLGYASLAAQLKKHMQNRKSQVIQNRVFGGLFVAAAAVMASKS